MRRLNLYPFFTQMMNLFPHPDFAVILEHMLFHPCIRPDANSSGAAGNGNWDTGCHFKKPWDKSLTEEHLARCALYLIQNYCRNLSFSHTVPDPPQPSPQPSCRLQPLDLERQQLKQQADIIMTARAEKIAKHVSQPLPFMHLSAVSCELWPPYKTGLFFLPNPIFPNKPAQDSTALKFALWGISEETWLLKYFQNLTHHKMKLFC